MFGNKNIFLEFVYVIICFVEMIILQHYLFNKFTINAVNWFSFISSVVIYYKIGISNTQQPTIFKLPTRKMIKMWCNSCFKFINLTKLKLCLHYCTKHMFRVCTTSQLNLKHNLMTFILLILKISMSWIWLLYPFSSCITQGKNYHMWNILSA